MFWAHCIQYVSGITLQDLLFFFENTEHMEEDKGNLVNFIDKEGLDSIYDAMHDKEKTLGEEDLVQLSELKDDDDVFRATMKNLLRKKTVRDIDLKKAQEERWKLFTGFERTVNDEVVMKGTEGIRDVLPGNFVPLAFKL